MADRFFKDIEVPDLPTEIDIDSPDDGFVSIYGKDGKLAYLDNGGQEYVIQHYPEIFVGSTDNLPPDQFPLRHAIVFEERTVNNKVVYQMKIHVADQADIVGQSTNEPE